MCTTLDEPLLLTGSRLVVVTGEVDVASAPELRAELAGALSGAWPEVVVDASGVTFIDCAGLRELEVARAALAASGRRLVLRSPSREVRQLLRWTGLTGSFAVLAP